MKPLILWSQWSSGVTPKGDSDYATIHHITNGVVHYSYAETTPAGVFSA